MKKAEIYQALIQRMAEDATFKEKVLSNPNETIKGFIKNEFNISDELLKNATFKIYAEKKNEYMVAIPHEVLESSELSEEELSSLAGGDCITPYGGIGC
jgi:hypothetical protein